jgi:hypothetical protein
VAREVTWGENGWHYHQHQLAYVAPGSFVEDVWRADWLACLDYVGRRWRGAELHAFDSGAVGDEAGARYTAKLATAVEAQARAIGSEIASSATKGKNLATLLAMAARGDEAAGKVWLAGVQEITARKVSSVRWSRGLRDRLGIQKETTDEQVAAEEVLPSDQYLGQLTPMQWRGILQWRAEFALCVAANKGREAVNEFLAGLELGQLDDAPPAAVFTQLKGDIAYANL